MTSFVILQRKNPNKVELFSDTWESQHDDDFLGENLKNLPKYNKNGNNKKFQNYPVDQKLTSVDHSQPVNFLFSAVVAMSTVTDR